MGIHARKPKCMSVYQFSKARRTNLGRVLLVGPRTLLHLETTTNSSGDVRAGAEVEQVFLAILAGDQCVLLQFLPSGSGKDLK
jgi:hypothetical protein